jgi:hypothetical protein
MTHLNAKRSEERMSALYDCIAHEYSLTPVAIIRRMTVCDPRNFQQSAPAQVEFGTRLVMGTDQKLSSLVIPPQIGEEASYRDEEQKRVVRAISSYRNNNMPFALFQFYGTNSVICAFFDGSPVNLTNFTKVKHSHDPQLVARALKGLLLSYTTITTLIVITRLNIFVASRTTGRKNAIITIDVENNVFQSHIDAGICVYALNNTVVDLFVIQSSGRIDNDTTNTFLDCTLMLEKNFNDRAHMYYMVNHLKQTGVSSIFHLTFKTASPLYTVIPIPRRIGEIVLLVEHPTKEIKFTHRRASINGSYMAGVLDMRQFQYGEQECRRIMRSLSHSRVTPIFFDIVAYLSTGNEIMYGLEIDKVVTLTDYPVTMLHKSVIISDRMARITRDNHETQRKHIYWLIASLVQSKKPAIHALKPMVENNAVTASDFKKQLDTIMVGSGDAIRAYGLAVPIPKHPLDAQIQGLMNLALFTDKMPALTAWDILGYFHCAKSTEQQERAYAGRVLSIMHKCLQWVQSQ